MLNEKLKNYATPSINEETKQYLANSELFMNDLLQSLTNFIKLGVTPKEISDLLNYESKLKNLAREIDLFNNPELQTAYHIGILKAIIEIIHHQNIKNPEPPNKELEEILHHKHLSNLISILYQKNSLTHNELANELRISKSALTNMITKTESLNIFTIEKRGKYKYYYSNLKTKEAYIRLSDSSFNQLFNRSDIEKMFNIVFFILCEEIKNNNQLQYDAIIKRLPIFETFKCKNSNETLQYFVKIVNTKMPKKYQERENFMQKNISEPKITTDYMIEQKKFNII